MRAHLVPRTYHRRAARGFRPSDRYCTVCEPAQSSARTACTPESGRGCEALPSTALPSTHVPLTIEMSALHGYFFINFIQYFDEYDYFSTFLDQLRQNDIDYDVLNVAEARYPRVEFPQWNL